MSTQWKWVIGVVSIVVVLALLACGIFFAWRYFFPGKPSVVIVAPPSNYEALEGDEVTVEARATGRSIVRVELWVDDGLMDSASSPSPQDAFSAALTWQASGVGSHTVEVKAYDARGQASEPAAIVLIVTTEVAEATPTITVGPSFETPSPTTSPTATPTSPPAATPTPTSPPPTATPTETPIPPTATPTSPPPSCPATFAASPETQTQGSPFDLNWHVENATALHLSGPEVGDHEAVTGPDGSRTVCCPPAGTHTYTLHVSCPAGDFDRQVTVTVTPAGPTTVTRNPMGGNESGTVYNAACGIGVLYTHSIAGDTAADCVARGYMSFDVSDLSGVHVVSAQLDITGCPVTGNPFGSSLNGIRVDHTQWSLPLDQTDWAPGAGTGIVWLHSGPASPINVAGNVQFSIDHGWNRFQVMMRPDGPSDGDHAVDWINCIHSKPVLTITYEP